MPKTNDPWHHKLNRDQHTLIFLEGGEKDGLRLAEETGLRFFENFIDLRGASFYSTIHFENDVKVYGNFPNPFSDRTFFAYEIFGFPVEEVVFKIWILRINWTLQHA